MTWFANLKISTKINLILSLLFLLLIITAALFTYKRQQAIIYTVAADNARHFARLIIETRDYMSSVVQDEAEKNYGLVPQVVATQVAKRMTRESKYYVRQISLRYRNPDNRPDPYEAARLQQFAAKTASESSAISKVNGQQAFRYMLPMIAGKSCLECHGEYDKAPQFVRQRFPRGHISYNYQLGEVIGAVSVTIPVDDLYREIGANLKVDIAYRALAFLLIILAMAAVLRKAVIKPISLLSETISRVTRTGSFSERMPQKGNDEVGQLIGAFNEMMAELGARNEQSRESEQRYRKLIEMSRSAVVTFMTDGKIIISNQGAEQLFGLSRQGLLGESIFNFMKEGDELQEGIARFAQSGTGGGVGETRPLMVKDIHGTLKEVEMALSASSAEQKPLFTAILRDLSADKP